MLQCARQFCGMAASTLVDTAILSHCLKPRLRAPALPRGVRCCKNVPTRLWSRVTHVSLFRVGACSACIHCFQTLQLSYTLASPLDELGIDIRDLML